MTTSSRSRAIAGAGAGSGTGSRPVRPAVEAASCAADAWTDIVVTVLRWCWRLTVSPRMRSATHGAPSPLRRVRIAPDGPSTGRTTQPRARLNCPQIAVGCHAAGRPGRAVAHASISVQPVAEQTLEPGLVLRQEARPGPACPGPMRHGGRGAGCLGVVELGRDGRPAAPRRADDEPAERAVVADQDPRSVRLWRTRGGGARGPRPSPRRRAPRSPPGRAASNERRRGSARAVEPRRLEHLVPRLDLEPEPLVETAGPSRSRSAGRSAHRPPRPRRWSRPGQGRGRGRVDAMPGRPRPCRSRRPSR